MFRGAPADLLRDVPEAHGAVLCGGQEHVPGGVGAHAPDGPVHVAVHQDVARSVLLPHLDDLRVTHAHQDLSLQDGGGGERRIGEPQPWQQ